MSVLEFSGRATDSEPYEDQLVAEAASWLIEDRRVRSEKIRRERMRHPKLIRDLLLDQLGTHDMHIAEIGGGPTPLSDLLSFRTRVVYDPLADQYRRFFPCVHHVALMGEAIDVLGVFDLVIATNSLDHVRDPKRVVLNILDSLVPGGWFAVMCAENNAITNPHPAHVHNLTAEILHGWCDSACETVWELTFRKDDYRYGWVEFEGRRGQPAFALLLRKCSGYASQR